MRWLDLFSGIGGFALGLQRAGFPPPLAFCEIDPFCRQVLRKHWPEVPIIHDITTLRIHDRLDLLTGGFPCQDISCAGKGAGLDGARSGLWREMHRVIAETRPQWIIAENVPALRSRGLDQVLGALVALGYCVRWDCHPASAVGACHRRDRIWLVGYAHGGRQPEQPECVRRTKAREQGAQRDHAVRLRDDVPYAISDELREQPGRRGWQNRESPTQPGEHGAPQHLADSERAGLEILVRFGDHLAAQLAAAQRDREEGRGAWAIESDVGRVVNGLPDRVHRVKALGNAVVPQVVERIGLAILSSGTALGGPK